MIKTFIYGLLDPLTSDLRYVGKSDNPEKRLVQHMIHCNKDITHKGFWLSNLKSKGSEPKLRIIAIVPANRWQKFERYYIRYYTNLGCKLTNTASGGEGFGSGKNNLFFGKRHTEETKKVMSEKAKGRIISEKTKIKMGNSRRGRKHTEETKRKIALSKLGDKNPQRQKEFTEKDRKRMSEISKKRVFTEEYRKNLSIAAKGRVFSEKHKRNISSSKKGIPNPLNRKDFTEKIKFPKSIMRGPRFLLGYRKQKYLEQLSLGTI